MAIFLFWLWLLALSLLVGGEVNAQLEGVRDEADNLAKEAEAIEAAAAEIAAAAKINDRDLYSGENTIGYVTVTIPPSGCGNESP